MGSSSAAPANKPHPRKAKAACTGIVYARLPAQPPRRAEQISARDAHRPFVPIDLFYWATSATASQILWGFSGALAAIPVDAQMLHPLPGKQI